MKVAITGDGQITADEIQEMLDHYDIKVDTLLSVSETDLEKAFEEWASANDVAVEVRTADWGNLDVDRCKKKEGKYGFYNARAAFNRNDDMVTDADCLIQVHEHTRSSSGMIEFAGKTETKVYQWPILEENDVPF